MQKNNLWMLVAGCSLLAACGGGWFGSDDEDEKKLEGDRIAVLDYKRDISIDSDLSQTHTGIGDATLNDDFSAETAAQQAGYDNLALNGLEERARVSVGEGNGWETMLVPQPVIAGGTLFAMDAAGFVSAHDATDVDRVRWVSNALVLEDEIEIAGGGLAAGDGVVYATSGAGSVWALVAADGSVLWRKDAGIPLRAAPTLAEGTLYAVTIDNQLLAYEARTGKLLWTHRGIRESAVYLATVSPAVQNGIVVVAYSSGEIYALRAQDGSPIWSDTLLVSKRTYAGNALTGIDATPIVRDGVVYAISNNSLLAANLLSNGRGLWDMEVAGYHTPWIGGDYLYVLSSSNQLLAVHRRSGLVRWATDIELDEEERVRFGSPMIAGDRLMLVSDVGLALFFDPATGALLERIDIADEVRTTPVVAGGRAYFLTADAELVVYE